MSMYDPAQLPPFAETQSETLYRKGFKMVFDYNLSIIKGEMGLLSGKRVKLAEFIADNEPRLTAEHYAALVASLNGIQTRIC